MTDAPPRNALAVAIGDARAGRIPAPELFRTLVTSDIAIPSGAEVAADGSGFQPVLFDKEGVKMVACFSSLEGVSAVSHLAPYALSMKGGQFLSRVPSGYGVVLDPGGVEGFDISPDGVRRIVQDFVAVAS